MKGLWYEQSRDRYRVRVMKNKRVFHLSYHKSRAEAETVLTLIRRAYSPTEPRILRLVYQTKLYFGT